MRRIVVSFSNLLISSLLSQIPLWVLSPGRALGVDCTSPSPTVCGSTFANGDSQGVFMSTAAVPPFPIEFDGVGNTAAIVGSGPGGMSASSMANANYGWLQAFSIADNGSFTTQVFSFIGRGRTNTGGDASFRDGITVNSGVLPAGQPVQMKVIFSGSGAYAPGQNSSGNGTLQYSVFSITRNFFLVLTPNQVISLNSQFPTWVAQHTLDVLVGEKLEITMNIQTRANTNNEFPDLLIAGAADTSARAFLDSLNPDVTLDAASGYDYRSNATGPVTLQVVCPVAKLQNMLDDARAGTTLSVFGNCSENVIIRNEKQRITIDGNNNATISGPNANAPTVNVRGKGILIQNFAGITGGNSGIDVNRGSNAVINSNTIHNTGGNGVIVDELAFAALINNTIQNNPGAGVFIAENSTARIGFNADSETTVSPNTIQSNAIGVVVSNGSSARIIGNSIINNSADGVQVLRDSHSEIASNALNANGGDGIEVGENSFVQLGEDSGTSIYESTNTGTNTGFGIKCADGGIADGRLGTLDGVAGAKSFGDPTCIDSVN